MNILKYGKYFIILLLLLNVVVAQVPPHLQDQEKDPATQSILNAVCAMVELVRSSMGAVFLILVVLAAIVYAAGQVLGAETRARANVWATSMFVGAIIGGLIFLIVPIFLSQLIGQDISSACGVESQTPHA